MHTFAKFNQKIPCGSRVMIIFTNCYWLDKLSRTVIIVHTCGLCNIQLFCFFFLGRFRGVKLNMLNGVVNHMFLCSYVVRENGTLHVKKVDLWVFRKLNWVMAILQFVIIVLSKVIPISDLGQGGLHATAEMRRDTRFPTMWYVRPAKAQTSLRIRAD